MMDDDGSVVVIRFSPFTEAGLMKSIRRQVEFDYQSGISPRNGVSVFAGAAKSGETVTDTVNRLCEFASANAGGERVAVTTELTLNQKGYALHLSEPPAGHYLVGNADLSVEPQLPGLAEIFAENRQKNSAYGKGSHDE
jgi:hypothetical protein